MRILPAFSQLLSRPRFTRALSRQTGAGFYALTDLSGKKHELSDFKGKYVVLEWVNFGCPFVKKHYGSENMQKLQKEFVDKGVVWLSICSSAPGKQGNETPDAAKKGISKFGSAATAYLVDEDGKVGRLYNAKTTPEMFVVNPEGVDLCRSHR